MAEEFYQQLAAYCWKWYDNISFPYMFIFSCIFDESVFCKVTTALKISEVYKYYVNKSIVRE